jgi:hypothetical protein
MITGDGYVIDYSVGNSFAARPALWVKASIFSVQTGLKVSSTGAGAQDFSDTVRDQTINLTRNASAQQTITLTGTITDSELSSSSVTWVSNEIPLSWSFASGITASGASKTITIGAGTTGTLTISVIATDDPSKAVTVTINVMQVDSFTVSATGAATQMSTSSDFSLHLFQKNETQTITLTAAVTGSYIPTTLAAWTRGGTNTDWGAERRIATTYIITVAANGSNTFTVVAKALEDPARTLTVTVNVTAVTSFDITASVPTSSSQNFTNATENKGLYLMKSNMQQTVTLSANVDGTHLPTGTITWVGTAPEGWTFAPGTGTTTASGAANTLTIPANSSGLFQVTISATDDDSKSFTVWVCVGEREGEEGLIFTVAVSSGQDFIIPTSGYSATGGNASYSWDIYWGDGTTQNGVSGISTADLGSAGITHTYQTTGTFAIAILPHDTAAPFQWARAFGFSSGSSLSAAYANKGKVTSVIKMPVKGYLQSATATGAYFLFATWRECTNLRTAVVPDTSSWNITSIGDWFLAYTWYSCRNLTTAVVPNTSNWNITSIGDYFLALTWQTCTSLTNAGVPNTSNWNVTSIGTYFLAQTWNGCTSLTNAVVPNTSNWVVASVGTSFLSYTWENCSALKNLSNIQFSNSFKNVSNLYSNTGNWNQTFSLSSDPGGTTGNPPSFYDGTLVTYKTPFTDRNTFRYRTGMTGYDSFDANWK